MEPDRLANFVETLRKFDSHERGILLQWALGGPFVLSAALRAELDEHLPNPIPDNAYVAMDYVLDWLSASMTCILDTNALEAPQERTGNHISGSSEDVDLVIAWEDDLGAHLVLIEAKGFTRWSNKQLNSKAERLAAIFSAPGLNDLDLHFVLVGPRRSAGLEIDSWPQWMRRNDRFIFLEVPDPGPRWSVERGFKSTTGSWRKGQHDWTHWRLKRRRWS
jgi:hypothetical protein